MKNNIEKDLILNRKIVIEIRFKAQPKFLDLKGTLLDRIHNLNIIKNAEWSIGDSGFKISDNKDEILIRNLFTAELNRFSIVSYDVQSIEKFVSDFLKINDVIKEVLGELDILRIGCRILGTYRTKSNQFNIILKKFKESFPDEIFLKDFPTTDLRLQIVYQNGTYHIGPIQKDDGFLQREFRGPDRNNSVGIGLDTDNYLLKTSDNKINSTGKIKDVITASLAVEKSLVEKLKDF
jgi:hypothetical protein